MHRAATPDVTAPRRRGRPRWLLPLGVAILIGLAALGGRRAAAVVPAFVAWVHDLGPLGPIAFVLGYAVAAVALIPGSLLTLAAGAVFGLRTGIVLVLLGATLGSTTAFLVARHLAREHVRRRIIREPRFVALDGAIQREGRRIAFLLRLSPVFPFVLLNYALGLTSIRLRDYLVASVGMIPGTVLYVYYGRVAGDLAGLAAGTTPTNDPARYALLAIGLAATLAVTMTVTRLARRALAAATEEQVA